MTPFDPVDLLLLLAECADETATAINSSCPALAPPDGELPLNPNAHTMWSTTLGILIACCVLIAISMALRMFTRIRIVKQLFALEDSLIVIAAILFAPIVGLQLEAYEYGGGKHQWNVTIGDLYIALRYVYAVQIMYCLALYSAKISILLQIKHIFEGTQQRKAFIFWASWALIIAVSCAYLSTLMVLIFSCTPIRKAWDPLIPGRCHNSSAGYISGTINLVSDIAVLLLPVIGVAKLQMETRKKIAVSAVFATGLIACGVSALRLYFSSHEAESNDKTYWLALVGLCGAVEIAMVILCGCFTSFPRFVRWMKDERTGSGSRQYKKSYGYASENQSRSYGYRSESQSRLRYDAPSPIEMGRPGVMNEVRAAHQDGRTLR